MTSEELKISDQVYPHLITMYKNLYLHLNMHGYYRQLMTQGKKGFEDISSVIDSWFRKKNYTDRRTNFDAFHNWNEIVGPEIAKNTEPAKFYKDVLVIKVRNSVWMQELQFMKPRILEKIRSSFPDTKIKDLMFRIGSLK